MTLLTKPIYAGAYGFGETTGKTVSIEKSVASAFGTQSVGRSANAML